MNKYCLIIGILLSTLLLSCKSKNEDQASSGAMGIDVALPVTDSLMLRKSYPGYLSSEIKVDLVARVSGFLQSINFKAGQQVKKGQILFVIEPKTYKDAVTQAQAELATAISQNQYAKSNFESIKEASASNAVSKIDLVQAESQLHQSIAAIKNAEAALNTAKINLSYCYIKAPCSGTITKSSYDVGNYLNGSVSPPTIATIYNNENVYIYFSIEDSQYMKMVSARKDPDQKAYENVNILFNSSLPHNYVGKLDYLAPQVDLSTGTLTIRAKIANPYNELKSGMYATVSLPYKEMSKAILIRDASIGTDQLGKFIYVVNDSNKVVYTSIQVGDLYQDSLRIVTSGLKANQRYVTKALLKVRDGMTIKPILTK